MTGKYQAACLHCPGGSSLAYPLFEDQEFWIVCDCNPLVKGHIEVMPREHISCMAALSDKLFKKYQKLYQQVREFIQESYGPVAVFEHGVIGQTVFHAHTHFLPFKGTVNDIVSQDNFLKKINSLDQLRVEFKIQGEYLYLEVENEKYFVDTVLGYPKFFRELFAKALGVEERGDWRLAKKNPKLKKEFEKDIADLQEKWKQFAEENN